MHMCMRAQLIEVPFVPVPQMIQELHRFFALKCAEKLWKAEISSMPGFLSRALGGNLYFFGSVASQMNSGVTCLHIALRQNETAVSA